MSQTYRPESPAQLADLVCWAVSSATPLEVRGQGTRAALGRPANTAHRLDMSGMAGIVDYEPNELVLTAHAGTPMAEVEAALSAEGQMLAFEPPDWRALLGVPAGPDDPAGTLGGLIACNLSGPRRLSAGAARDHVLGVKGVSGRGEPFKSGGRVVKNVSGFDVSKLMTGSFGTLAALTELSVKVMPRPEDVRTVVIQGVDPADSGRVMSEGVRSPHEVSGAAFLPASVVPRLGGAGLREAGRSLVLLRVEGPEPSVTWRATALQNELAGWGPTAVLDAVDSAGVWAEIRNVRPLVDPPDAHVWRLSVPPMNGARVVQAIDQAAPGALLGWVSDWAGGLLWLSTAPTPDAHAGAIRTAVEHHGGGHATLIRAPADVRAHVPVLHPRPAPLEALSRRVKDSFDPTGILNPGRMAEGR